MALDPNRQKYIEALRRAAMGPRGVAGPDGNLVPMTSGTLSEGKSPSNLQKLYKMLPQGGYGVSQTIGPLATAANPLPSLKRTFTGENARQYLNFGEGGPGWKQRAMLAGEDALNIAGAVGGAAKAADYALNDTYMFGKTLLHGTPETITSGYIEPRLGSRYLPNENVVYGFDPKKFTNTTDLYMKDLAYTRFKDRTLTDLSNLSKEELFSLGPDGLKEYIKKNGIRGAGNTPGEMHLARAKRNSLYEAKIKSAGWPNNPQILYSTEPLKILDTVKIPGEKGTISDMWRYGTPHNVARNELAEAFTRVGGAPRPKVTPRSMWNNFKWQWQDAFDAGSDTV